MKHKDTVIKLPTAENSSGEPADKATFTSLEQLHRAYAEQQQGLSKRLTQVAAWLLEHPSQAAFSTLAEIAEAAGVHPSTLIRFANYFHFSGFSELQKLYKNELLENSGSYQQRISRVKQIHPNDSTESLSKQLLHEFVSANSMAMELLNAQASAEQLDAAVETLYQAGDIHICGFRRMSAVAQYLHYTLSQLGVRSQMINGSHGLLSEQLQWLTPDSLLFAMTFSPYTQSSRDAITQAHEAGAEIILITDSELCPLASMADHLFVVREAEVRSFRSMTTILCLVQTLCVALGYRHQEEGDK